MSYFWLEDVRSESVSCWPAAHARSTIESFVLLWHLVDECQLPRPSSSSSQVTRPWPVRRDSGHVCGRRSHKKDITERNAAQECRNPYRQPGGTTQRRSIALDRPYPSLPSRGHATMCDRHLQSGIVQIEKTTPSLSECCKGFCEVEWALCTARKHAPAAQRGEPEPDGSPSLAAHASAVSWRWSEC